MLGSTATGDQGKENPGNNRDATNGEQVFSPRLSVGTDVVLALGIPARTAFVSRTQTQRIVGMPSYHCEGEEQGNRL